MKLPFTIGRCAMLIGLLTGEVRALSLQDLPAEKVSVWIDRSEARLPLLLDVTALAPGFQFRAAPELAFIFDPSYVQNYLYPWPAGPVRVGSSPVPKDDRPSQSGHGKFNFNIGYQF